MATSWTRRISFVCPTITVADRLAIVAGARTRHPAGATSGISGVTKRISQGRATADDAVPALCASLPGEIPEVPRPGRILARGEGETGTPRLPMEGNPAPFPLGMALQFEIDVQPISSRKLLATDLHARGDPASAHPGAGPRSRRHPVDRSPARRRQRDRRRFRRTRPWHRSHGALAGGGGFSTVSPTGHSLTNAEVIHCFTGRRIDFTPQADGTHGVSLA